MLYFSKKYFFSHVEINELQLDLRSVFLKLSFSKMKKVQLDIYFLIITFNSCFLHVTIHVTFECSKRLKCLIVPDGT